MQPLQAVVKNGRIHLDAPTDLPEGEVVTLIALEELLAEAGDADEGEEPVFRFAMPAPQFREPKAVDASALIAELRAL